MIWSTFSRVNVADRALRWAEGTIGHGCELRPIAHHRHEPPAKGQITLAVSQTIPHFQFFSGQTCRTSSRCLKFFNWVVIGWVESTGDPLFAGGLDEGFLAFFVVEVEAIAGGATDRGGATQVDAVG